MQIVLPGLVAVLINLVLLPLIMLIAKRKGWFDKPDPRKIHTGQISRLGGVGIFVSVILAILVSYFFIPSLGGWLARYWSIILAMLVLHGLGLVDDFYDLRARFRLLIQVLASTLVMLAGFRFGHVWLPGLGSLALGWLSWPLTLLWLVGVINALNMIDGMDGLSGGVSIIAALGFGLILVQNQAVFASVVAFSLVGALAAYLVFNFPPAKIFMGDSGSTFLGFTLAVLPLLDTQGGASGLWFWTAITLLLLPILDVFAAMWRRKRNRVSMMSPDKWHIHHKLMHFGLRPRPILAILYSLCVLAALVALTVLLLPPAWFWLLAILSWLLVSGFFLILHFAKERSLRT